MLTLPIAITLKSKINPIKYNAYAYFFQKTVEIAAPQNRNTSPKHNRVICFVPQGYICPELTEHNMQTPNDEIIKIKQNGKDGIDFILVQQLISTSIEFQ
jgi:hypothetical protein